MMQVVLCATLGWLPLQGSGCENIGTHWVEGRIVHGRDLGCGYCPIDSVYTPAHSEPVAQPGRRIVRTIELQVSRITRQCQVQGTELGFFDGLVFHLACSRHCRRCPRELLR